MPSLGNIFHYETSIDTGNGITIFNKCHMYIKTTQDPHGYFDTIVFDIQSLTIFMYSADNTKLGPYQLTLG
jgi:hypothetical protein